MSQSVVLVYDNQKPYHGYQITKDIIIYIFLLLFCVFPILLILIQSIYASAILALFFFSYLCLQLKCNYRLCGFFQVDGKKQHFFRSIQTIFPSKASTSSRPVCSRIGKFGAINEMMKFVGIKDFNKIRDTINQTKKGCYTKFTHDF